jgi:hypothetical protein
MWTSVTWNSAADFARALRGVVVEFNRKDVADGRWFPNTYQRRATRSASAVSFLRALLVGVVAAGVSGAAGIGYCSLYVLNESSPSLHKVAISARTPAPIRES